MMMRGVAVAAVAVILAACLVSSASSKPVPVMPTEFTVEVKWSSTATDLKGDMKVSFSKKLDHLFFTVSGVYEGTNIQYIADADVAHKNCFDGEQDSGSGGSCAKDDCENFPVETLDFPADSTFIGTETVDGHAVDHFHSAEDTMDFWLLKDTNLAYKLVDVELGHSYTAIFSNWNIHTPAAAEFGPIPAWCKA